jgi:predicted GH43/DUF377 family glycosyl hydrolase
MNKIFIEWRVRSILVAVTCWGAATWVGMSVLTPPITAAEAPSPVAVIPAKEGGRSVGDEAMKRVYDEVKTPYKYGVIIRGEPGKLADCPSVFRFGSKWYLVYISSTGQTGGYETFLAESDDLLRWKKLGKILPHARTGWDAWQAAGFIALQDYTWGGTHQLQPYDGKYWLSYCGAPRFGYEPDPFAVGIAWTEDPTKAVAWRRIAENPVLHNGQPDVRQFEKVGIFKSNVIWDKDNTTGFPFVMFYNAKSGRHESIGMAVSKDMIHWQRYGNDSVINAGVGICGDPQVVKIGDLWVMFYFGCGWKPKAFDTFACSYDLAHWTRWTGQHLIEPSEPWDAVYAHKPWIIKHDGVVYHFYCSVSTDTVDPPSCEGRTIAVATSKDMRH